MQSIGDRVKKARKAAGMSQPELARAVGGITYQTIQQLESGESHGSKHLLRIARALSVNPEWLESGQGVMAEPGRDWAGPSITTSNENNIVEINGAEFARIAIYDVQLAAGAGATGAYEGEPPLDYHYMSLSLLRSLTSSPMDYISGVQIRGDSMEDTLHNRDWAIVDGLQRRLIREGLFGLNRDGEAIVKRVSQHIETGAVTLISDNPKYPPQLIKKPERLIVVGRVILSIRRH